MITLQDINKNLPGGNNMGGTKQKFWIGFHADVLTWPNAPDPAANLSLEQNGAYTGNLIMKEGKRLFSFYITDDTGELKMPFVGDIDGQSFEMDFSCFHPGLQKKILGFLNASKNDNLVLIVPDAEGQKYILGDSERPCVMNGGDGPNTGKATKDRKGTGMTFKYKTNSILVYGGTIPDTIPVESGSGSASGI